jgi:hypothetical protein
MFKAHKKNCFIVNYADLEGGSFLMWGFIKMAICTVNEMEEFCWFFYPDVTGG